MEKKQEGTVKTFDEAKGWGFIATDDGPDIFVHQSNILGGGFRTLKKGQRVEFDICEGRNDRPMATEVEVLY